jgi:hypothetical protein
VRIAELKKATGNRHKVIADLRLQRADLNKVQKIKLIADSCQLIASCNSKLKTKNYALQHTASGTSKAFLGNPFQ